MGEGTIGKLRGQTKGNGGSVVYDFLLSNWTIWPIGFIDNRLFGLLLSMSRIYRCAKGKESAIRCRYFQASAHCHGIRDRIQVILWARTRLAAEASCEAQGGTISHYSTGRTGWVWGSLLSQKARNRRGMCTQENAEADVIQDG